MGQDALKRSALVACALLVLAAAATAPAAATCAWFPPENPLHQDVSALPVHPWSSRIIAAINPSDTALETGMHADFAGEDGGILYGIPITRVDTSAGWEFAAIDFVDYDEESDPGPYPFPFNASIEGTYPGCSYSACGGDRHVLTVDSGTCTLYEAWNCRNPFYNNSALHWACSNGAKFNLSSPNMPQRTLGFTSGDAAGLPIAPLLVRIEDIKAGVIDHAIRFTVRQSQAVYAYPASHYARRFPYTFSPWMGLRARLRATFACGGLQTGTAQIICRAMQKYGLILADNGSNFYLSGEASEEWANVTGGDLDAFHADMRSIQAKHIDVVDPGERLCFKSDPGCGDWRDTLWPERAFQAGRAVNRADGTTDPAYSKAVDAAISNLGTSAGAANGAAIFPGQNASLPLAEPTAGTGPAWRALLRFGGLDAYIPPKQHAKLLAFSLELTFENVPQDLAGEGFLVPQAWSATPGPDASKSLGWAYRAPNAKAPATKPPLKWTTPGVWPARNPKNAFSFTIPAGSASKVFISVPAAAFTSWMKAKDASNFGVLVKLQPGAPAAARLASGSHPDASARPLLRVAYQAL